MTTARHRWSTDADRALLEARRQGASWADVARIVEGLRGVPTTPRAAQQRASYLARTRRQARYHVTARRRGEVWRVCVEGAGTTTWHITTRSLDELRAWLDAR